MGYYFNSYGYLTLAKAIHPKASELGDDEAAFRTVVGRCYYGAFLKARDFLGLADARLDDIHKVVEQQLKARDLAVGSMLGELRRERNKADYSLDEQIGSVVSGNAIHRAEEIIQNMN